MKTALMIVCAATLALAACRREVPYEPMKLGGAGHTVGDQR